MAVRARSISAGVLSGVETQRELRLVEVDAPRGFDGEQGKPVGGGDLGGRSPAEPAMKTRLLYWLS